MKQVPLGISAESDNLNIAKKHGRGTNLGVWELADGVEKALEPIEGAGLKVCQVISGHNPLHPDDEARRKSEDTLRSALPHVERIGCPYIMINGGNLHPNAFGHGDPFNFTQEAIDLVVERLTPLAKEAEDAGAILTFEPYVKTCAGSPERIVEIIERVDSPSLKCNVDVQNFYDLMDMFDTAPKVEKVCKALAPHIGLVHVKDAALKPGFHVHIELTPISEGPTDWTQVFSLVGPHIPEGSWVVLEHMMDMAEADVSVPFLKEKAAAAGVELVS